ncbi:MAG TPA: EAL domain-containing protein [Burkholderiaceae bacterium]
MPPSRFRSRLSPPALVVLAAGLAITVLAFAAARHAEFERIDQDLQQRVDERFVAVMDGYRNALESLLNVNRLFDVHPGITREQFEDFTRPIVARHPYIQAFGFERTITAAERAGYEAQMRKINPDFRITQLDRNRRIAVPDQPDYLVVDYVSPLEGNVAALGLDVTNNASIMQAGEMARRLRLPVATDLFRLAQRNGDQSGFLVSLPVYALEKGKEKLAGFTTVVFRSQALVEGALAAADLRPLPGMEFKVYLGAVGDAAHTVYLHRERMEPSETESIFPRWLFFDRPPPIVHSFDAAGKTWHIEAIAETDFFAARASRALGLLVLGTALTVLLALYIQFQADRSRRIAALVEKRTGELVEANRLLAQDNEARRVAEQALRMRERAIEASNNAVVITSAAAPLFPIEYVNPAFQRITGFSAQDVIGRSCSILWGKDSEQSGMREILQSGMEQREGHATMRNYRKDGTPFWCEIFIAPVRDDAGKVEHFVAIQYDITETRHYQEELETLTNRDGLTGLANRNLLNDRLSQAIVHASNHRQILWIAYLDLDRFKFVNDAVGHKVGDRLLRQVARRLEAALRNSDTVARVGADEFILVLEERADELEVADDLQNLLDAIAKPLNDDGHEFFLTGSIGVAAYPNDGNDAETLIKHADIAMYRAKELGRNNAQFFTAMMNQRALERLRIESDLRNALERQEFLLHYQPQVDLNTGRVLGVEALLRWQHRELGLVPPGRFIALAEETGLIVPLGAWVLQTACRQVKQWQDEGLGPLRVAVNLSARQFGQKDLVESVAETLLETGLDPACLEIELTESLVMTDVERAIGVLRNLKSLGVKLSIDDFGTGYSSLSYLKRFPIDVLKIDQSFVRDIALDPEDAAIAAAIISLAHSLRLHVIAEGVETEAQLTFLRRHGCDQMQGYYFSRPLAAADMQRMLAAGTGLAPSSERSRTRRQTVLTVDPDPHVGTALARVLRSEGYEILHARTPEEAFDMLALHEIGVIIADERLGTMNGIEFFRRVKDIHPQAMRIMLSGFIVAEALVDAVNRGEIFRFHGKPWDDQSLRDDVREAFHRRQPPSGD